MKVIVAEKPSVARDLARHLGARNRREGAIEGNGWIVSWALGHLAELKTPDEYDPALKRWTLEALPFVPAKFELRPAGDAAARRQLEIVAAHCRDADELVCATDAGREGELIFRYLLEIAGCPGRAFQRLWLSALTDEAIRGAFANLRPGGDYEPLHDAARSRSEADWIVGLNATRAFTVCYGGGRVLWSVGRVQTPVLALIAARDDEIRVFVAARFWELRTRYRDVRFKHKGERFFDREAADAMLQRVRGTELEVTAVQCKRESQPPPLLYDLTQLQRDLNLRHGMPAARTLQLAQELYERKLLTYPRTDCRHLPASMLEPVRGTLKSLARWRPAIAERVDADAIEARRRVFDDGKVSDHHAIVPTGKLPADLAPDAASVFEAVARRLVQVFMADKDQEVTTVEAQCAGVPFRARGVRVLEPGWTALEPAVATRRKVGKKQAEDEDDQQVLPEFEAGERGPHAPELHQGDTKPPRPYTENTLLGAMETAGKLVDDEALREALKERGLGTPATRAAIVETLLSRGYITREKKALRVTDLGRYLVAIVRDPLLKSPELTGGWEQKLKQIEAGAAARADFMRDIVGYIEQLIGEGVTPQRIDGLGRCPRCSRPMVEGREAFGCSGWSEGCEYKLSKTYRGATLTARIVGELMQRRVCLAPVRLEEDGARVLCLTASGAVIDVAQPSRDAQARGRGAAQRAGRRQRAAKSTARRAPAAKSAGTKRKRRATAVELPPCPACRRPLVEGQRGYGCSGWQQGCKFVVWKAIAGKSIGAALVRTLVSKGKTRLLTGFVDDAGAEFRARLRIEGNAVRLEREAES